MKKIQQIFIVFNLETRLIYLCFLLQNLSLVTE